MAIHYTIVGAIVLLGYICSSAGNCSVNTPGVKTFGPECQYMCHCKKGASCDNETGECSDRCDTNWFGPACQYRDIAENGYTQQNNRSINGGSVYAVDGNTSTCSYTAEPSQSTATPYWRVNFPQLEVISDIYIHTRNDRLVYFPGFEVTVEYVNLIQRTDVDSLLRIRHTCYQHDNTVPRSRHIHVQCKQPLYGNQVRITLSKVRTQLVLCDVRINGGRNFAFRKPVTTSQYDSRFPPFNAVDGKLGAKHQRHGCFVSRNTGNKYFDINLGHSIYTYSINVNISSYDRLLKIYTTSATQTGEYVLNNLTTGRRPISYAQLRTTVQQLHIEKNEDGELSLCELQIFGECLANKCGFDCSENCYCKSFDDIAQRISGVCTTGCQNRWTGTAGKCNIAGNCSDTPGVKTFGPGCQYMCHCKKGASCDNDTGECSDRCDTNWFGPACQYRDIAEHGYTAQNSRSIINGGSYYAVDGNTSTCSYTAEPSQSTSMPYWRVGFPQLEVIRDVYIHTRNDRLVYFPGFEVTVEYGCDTYRSQMDYLLPKMKHTCYQHDNTVPKSRHIHVQCKQPLYGNQVRITLSKVRTQLVLCDVRINGGINFAFRKPVTTSQYDYRYPPFNAVDGKLGAMHETHGCFVSRNTGNKYFDINFGHSIYIYSINVNTSSYDSSLKIYTTSVTQTGEYVLNNRTKGYRYRPISYAQLRTTVQQLHIEKNEDGELRLCELQIFGECLANKCGFDCSENCYCKSFDDIKQRISGVCTTGCQNRWTGTAGKCNIECGDKKWGKQCQYDCGACRNGTCDVVSGKCTDVGLDGYNYTDDCKAEDSIQPHAIAIIAGSAVAGIVVICVTIVAVCIIMYRRRQPPSVITNPESHGEISNYPTSVSYRDLQSKDSTNDKEDTKKEPLIQKTINHGTIQENSDTRE